jgi:hypothetical protein
MIGPMVLVMPAINGTGHNYQFPMRATTRGLVSTIPVPPVKAHHAGPCVPAKRPGPAVLPCRKLPLGQARKA